MDSDREKDIEGKKMSFTPPKTTDKIRLFMDDLIPKLAMFYHRRNINDDVEDYGDIVVRSGWGYIRGNNAPDTWWVINYGITYDEEPLVFVVKIGTKLVSSGEPENIGDFPDPVGECNVGTRDIYTNQCDIILAAEEGGFLDDDYYWGYIWLTVGKKSWTSQATENLNILNYVDAMLPKLGKFFHRQRHTTNIEDYGNIVVRSGWTYKQGNDTQSLVWEDIPYGITYDEGRMHPPIEEEGTPLIILSSGPKRLVSEGPPAKLSDMKGATEWPEGKYPYKIGLTTFNARLQIEHDLYSSLYYYGLLWIAIGKKT